MNSNPEKPLVSIVCFTYNHADYIKDCLDGFLKQKTTFSFEVIVHDDASTDGAQDIIRAYEEKYPAIIKPIFHSENQYFKGIKPSTSRLLPKLRGEYVAMCEGDDFWMDTNKLQDQVEILESEMDCMGVFTNFCVIDKENTVIKKEGFDLQLEYVDHLEILKRTTPKTLTVVMRKSGIPIDMPKAYSKVKNADLFTHSMVSRKGPYKYLNRVTGAYRVHSGGIWSEIGKEERFKSQINTSLQLLRFYKTTEEVNAIRYRLKQACDGLIKYYGTNSKVSLMLYYQLKKRLSIFSAPISYWFKKLIKIS